MFTKIAEKLGILDIVAPRTAQQDASGSQKRKRMTPQEARDEALARKLQAEEDRRFKMLKAQKEAEELAEKYSKYAKRQRVSYHHRGKDKYYDAIIVGVHLDDGPDNPYYTIKYTMKNEEEDGSITDIVMEKQTNPDRLAKLPWDEDRTWEILR